LNRAQRRLSERGEVRFDLLSPGDPLVASAIARLVAFQRARFDARLDRTHMFDERFVRFRSDQAGKSPIRVATLSVGGEYVAVSMCAVFRGRLYAIVPGFDIAYADFSPGVLLKAFIIRSCFENGWDPCDFCWGDEQWKYRWTDSEMRLTTFVSDDAKGAVLATAAGARHGLIALRRRLWK
jgi:CelD/BcsL family acetyltransferase involved in cellulose biosynthesis